VTIAKRYTKTQGPALTSEERDILVLVAPHGKHLNNVEISQRLGLSVGRVKALIHQAYVKLEAENRIEALFSAMMRGEISLHEFYSLEELVELLTSLSPDVLRRIAHLVRQQSEHAYLPEEDEQIICTGRRQDSVLSKRERDVLILAGRGLTNREIANSLCMSIGSVRVFIYRACRKLGAHKRYDAIVLAMRQREISVSDIFSLNEFLQLLAPLGAESIERMAHLLDQKLEKEPAQTSS